MLTKRFLNNNSGVLWRVIDHSRGNVIALGWLSVEFASCCYLPPLLLNVVKERLHSVILERILKRTMANSLLGTVAESIGLHMLDNGIAELLVNIFMDIDSLQVQADLVIISIV